MSQLFKLSLLALFPFGSSVEEYERAHSSPATGCVTLFGNVLFLPLSVVLLVVHLVAGLIAACTVVGIPFAFAHVKLAQLAMCPFGRDAVRTGGYEHHTTTTTTTIRAAGGGGYQSIV